MNNVHPKNQLEIPQSKFYGMAGSIFNLCFFPLQHTSSYLLHYHTHIYVAKVGVVGGVLMVISGEERPSQHIEYFDQQVGITIQSISCIRSTFFWILQENIEYYIILLYIFETDFA